MPGIRGTMDEFKKGALRSSSGAPVTNRKQAIAIGLSEERRMGAPSSGGKSSKKVNPFQRGFSLKAAKTTAAPPPPAAAKSAGRMKLKAGRHGHGVVQSIRQGREYGDPQPTSHATVTVHHGPMQRPKGKNQGLIGGDENRSSTVHINAADAKHLSVGDKVKIHLEKINA